MDKLAVADMDTVCAVLDVTDKTVRTWIQDFGCPARKEGRAWVFDWPLVRAWYVDYQSSKRNGVTADFTPDDDTAPDDKENLTRATLRKTRAEADIKEMSLAKLRGEMVVIADARTRLERLLGNLRTGILGIAPKLSTRLAGERDLQKVEAVIKEEMEALCRDLSAGTVVGTRPEDTAPEPEPAELDLQAAAEAAEPAETHLANPNFQF